MINIYTERKLAPKLSQNGIGEAIQYHFIAIYMSLSSKITRIEICNVEMYFF